MDDNAAFMSVVLNLGLLGKKKSGCIVIKMLIIPQAVHVENKPCGAFIFNHLQCHRA